MPSSAVSSGRDENRLAIMHYYQHHIGDFIRDTANLTDSQVMAYLRLIWMYYDSEKPLPDNAKVLAFKIGSTEETVSLILEAFFTHEDGVWKHSRCESEIAEYNVIRERNIANGKGGGRPKKTQPKPSGFPVGFQSVASSNPSETQVEPCRNPNHKPVTSNQEEEKKKRRDAAGAADPDAPVVCTSDMMAEVSEGLARKFLAHRKQVKAKGPLTVDAWKLLLRQASSAGVTPEAAVQYAIDRGWQSFTANYYFNAEKVSAGRSQPGSTQAPAWMAGGI